MGVLPFHRPRLGFWDTTSVIVGIIIGVGIFEAPAEVFANVSGPAAVLGVWVLGGLLSLAGALCYAELASTYPRSGGEYVYLTRAFGPGTGFLFAWAQLAVIRTGGSIAAVAYIFADYAGRLWPLNPWEKAAAAGLAIAGLTVINLLGLHPGRRTHNALTVAKIVGLAGLVLAGLFGPAPIISPTAPAATGSFAVAMIFVLYAFAGWNEAAYVAAEVENRRRNLPLALIAGTATVAGIYLLVNLAYLAGLGFGGARQSPAVAADVLATVLGPAGGRVMAVLVMVSALGAINGVIFTGSRVYAELGADHRLFAILGRWDSQRGTPALALLVQAGLSIGLVAVVGLVGTGRSGFDALVKATAPVLWVFFLLTGLALFVLRFKEPAIERPFRVPLYPLLPLVFCGWSAYMLYGSLRFARQEAVIGVAVLAAGVPLYWLSQRWSWWCKGTSMLRLLHVTADAKGKTKRISRSA